MKKPIFDKSEYPIEPVFFIYFFLSLFLFVVVLSCCLFVGVFPLALSHSLYGFYLFLFIVFVFSCSFFGFSCLLFICWFVMLIDFIRYKIALKKYYYNLIDNLDCIKSNRKK